METDSGLIDQHPFPPVDLGSRLTHSRGRRMNDCKIKAARWLLAEGVPPHASSLMPLIRPQPIEVSVKMMIFSRSGARRCLAPVSIAMCGLAIAFGANATDDKWPSQARSVTWP